METPALYLAANGCDVTALVRAGRGRSACCDAAEEAGLGERVHAQRGGARLLDAGCAAHRGDLHSGGVHGLSAAERARVIQVLQSATADGGVHLVQTIAARQADAVSLDELRRRYRGWDVTVERRRRPNSFLARKGDQRRLASFQTDTPYAPCVPCHIRNTRHRVSTGRCDISKSLRDNDLQNASSWHP